MVNLEVLNPVASLQKAQDVSLAPRLSELNGKTIGLFWNYKPSGDTLNRLSAEALADKFKNMRFNEYIGSVGTAMRRASTEDVDRIAKECDAVVGSLAD